MPRHHEHRRAGARSPGRLGLDYIDHLVKHRHPHGVPGHVEVPIEKTLQALHGLVRAGKVLYLGASSMFAWQFAERVVEVAGRYGRTPAQIAIAWLLSKPAVTSPIVGVSRVNFPEREPSRGGAAPVPAGPLLPRQTNCVPVLHYT